MDVCRDDIGVVSPQRQALGMSEGRDKRGDLDDSGWLRITASSARSPLCDPGAPGGHQSTGLALLYIECKEKERSEVKTGREEPLIWLF